MMAPNARRLETEQENLAYWDKEAAPLQELCLLQARAAAEHAAALILSGELREPEDIATLCPTRKATDDPLLCLLETKERLAFCETLLKATSTLRVKATEEKKDTAASRAPLQIACLDNPLFATALTRFKKLLPHAATRTQATFSEVLDALTSGATSLGVLPIEDAREGRLLRLAEQLEGREIEVLLTRDITATDGNTVRFALLSHEALADTYRALLRENLAPADRDLILECAVLEVGGNALLETLAVAAACGLVLRRTDARPAPYREDGFFTYPTFKCPCEDSALFEAYLTLFLPRTLIAARYYHIIA